MKWEEGRSPESDEEVRDLARHREHASPTFPEFCGASPGGDGFEDDGMYPGVGGASLRGDDEWGCVSPGSRESDQNGIDDFEME